MEKLFRHNYETFLLLDIVVDYRCCLSPGDTPGGLPVVKRRPATSHPGGEGQQDAKSELPSCEEGTLPLPGLHLGGNL